MDLQSRGIKHEQDRLASLVRSTKDLEQARQLHREISHGAHTRGNTYLANLVVHMYGACGGICDARLAFESIARPNIFSWSALFQCYARHGLLHEAKRVFDRMPAWDSVVRTAMMGLYAEMGFLREAEAMFSDIQDADVVAWSAMIQAYARNGQLECAEVLFDRMPERNLVAWNTMLAGNAASGNQERAKELFDAMPVRDVISWTAMLQAFSVGSRISTVKNVFDSMPELNLVTWTALVAANAKAGDLGQALLLLDLMPQRSIVPFNCIVVGLCQHGYLDLALSVFHSMPEWNLASWNAMIGARLLDISEIPELNASSYANLMASHIKTSEFSRAVEVFDAAPFHNLVMWNLTVAANAQSGDLSRALELLTMIPEKSIVTHNVVLESLGKIGHYDGALKCFEKMPARDRTSWNSTLAAVTKRGHFGTAIDLFTRMSVEGSNPDPMTMASILAACSHLGGVFHARSCFHSMVADFGLGRPSLEHYCCMVDALGRAGRVHDAKELLDVMPFFPDESAAGSLAAAAKERGSAWNVHRRVELPTEERRYIGSLLLALPDVGIVERVPPGTSNLRGFRLEQLPLAVAAEGQSQKRLLGLDPAVAILGQDVGAHHLDVVDFDLEFLDSGLEALEGRFAGVDNDPCPVSSSASNLVPEKHHLVFQIGDDRFHR
ncbi:pentatricopeptide repeat-containing protein At2g35030, mitochondrial-like [Selaginella moellendorffii]|uniref:pentatricopeptide repeat-containing protein At2g35030, mitochondrial-like n=1 Tax=Selaginella moellendorffii TaxID=88036 RepID=UPI000D1C4130|nr:pentatricopeptide repeat-containing protein At2g35030, mitochondrial-like [Selaginella moellendorffii]|eukprot:XP_024529390.1 pentatricopeptide repeat-containing protein At2g35030, mitochondrial-like [Selaginella moellendorffii]